MRCRRAPSPRCDFVRLGVEFAHEVVVGGLLDAHATERAWLGLAAREKHMSVDFGSLTRVSAHEYVIMLVTGALD